MLRPVCRFKVTMMEVPVFSLEGREVGRQELPPVFEVPLRPDVIHRVFTALSTHILQAQGRDPLAGTRTSAVSFGVGRGIARMARVRGERYSRAGQAAGVASVVKGRQAHPPKAEKRIRKEVNRKERLLAIASAVAATGRREQVALRGHRVSKVPSLPLVVSDEVEELTKARELRGLYRSLGLEDDVERCSQGIRARSGKSRMRGRRARVPKGPLFVVSEDEGLGRAVRSFPGVECVVASDLSIPHLAPGGQAGRLTVWSSSALKSLPERFQRIASKFVREERDVGSRGMEAAVAVEGTSEGRRG